MIASASLLDWAGAVLFWPAVAVALAALVIHAYRNRWWWHDS